MRALKILIEKEIKNSLNTWGIYTGFIVFFCITGFYTWFSNNNIFYVGHASMVAIFENINWTQFLIIPAFTMRSFAEEKRNKTLELILTKPVRITELIGAKFLACFILSIVALFLTLPYYFTIASIGDVDLGAVILGYTGLLCIAACQISIGIFASALSRSPVSAFFIYLGIGVCFQFLFGIMAGQTDNTVIETIFTYLSLDEHFQTLLRGILDTRDILYFISIIALFLFLTKFKIDRSRY